MFQALYKKIHCDFHIYNPGVITPVSHWKLGPRRPETKYFMGKESTCHDPERKPRNQHEISTSHGFHDVQKKMSLQNLRTSLSILKHPTKQKSHYPPYTSRILLKYTPPSLFHKKNERRHGVGETPLPQQHLFASPSMRHHPWIELASGMTAKPRWMRNSKPQRSSKCPKKKYPPKVEHGT